MIESSGVRCKAVKFSWAFCNRHYFMFLFSGVNDKLALEDIPGPPINFDEIRKSFITSLISIGKPQIKVIF